MTPKLVDYQIFVENLVRLCQRGGAVFHSLDPRNDGVDVRVNAVREQGPYGEFDEWFGVDIESLAAALRAGLNIDVQGPGRQP